MSLVKRSNTARSILAFCLGAIAALWTTPAPAAAATSATELGGVELTASVRHQLWRVQQSWQSWSRAFLASDRQTADAELEQLRSLADHLGMSRLPDLSNAAAAYAVRMAQERDFSRADWALEAAESLDSGRPEVAFARSHVERANGDYLGAVASVIRGYLLLMQLPLERTLWLESVGLWALYSLVLSGALFVILLMANRGRSLFYDLSRLYSPPLDSLAADLVTVLVLIWPIFLPSGPVWLALYWSVLLWGYGSVSERGALIFLWLLLGVSPVILGYQQRTAQVAMVPASRLVDNLAAGRLYGAIFSDLEVLRSVVPDSDIVTEIVADLHRRLGQWEHARAIYTELSQDPERQVRHTATAYTNIGVYYHRRGEYQNAVNYFKRATEADPTLAEAFFDLSQSYAQLYDFNSHHEAMARAKDLAGDKVDRWNDAEATAEESAIAVDGGLRRVGELRERIEQLWQRPGQPFDIMEAWRRYRALSVALVAIILAVVLRLLRKQLGLGRSENLQLATSGWAENRWLQALVPGLASMEEERGISALIGILIPVGLLSSFLLDSLGYRPPLALDPGQWLVMAFAGAALVLVYLVRLGAALSD
ncbi:MAG: tetratricopeptide repeat protein [Holophagales bacterium]|nr:tetratricopeptide repeat protein [Holophagales bacterium]